MSASKEATHVQSSTPDSATTLRTIVELVRGIMNADVASILSYSLVDDTVTWKAASGFTSPGIDYQTSVKRPLAVDFARRALGQKEVLIFQGIGSRPELPAESFPVHVIEGVHDLAVAPLRIQGTNSGAVTAGFRTPHRFTAKEKKLLQDLAEMASLALDNTRLLETVSANEERLRVAHQVARMGTFEWDIKTGVNTWSPELEAMYGLWPGEFAGRQATWEDLIHPDDRANAIAAVQQAFKTDEPVESEWRVTWPSGSVHWLFGRFQLFRDDAGQPQRLTGVNLDITDRKRVEDVLRDSESRAQQSRTIWETTFDAIGEGILVYDQQKVIRCNAKAAEMMDLNPDDVIGLSFNDAFARMFGKRAADYYLGDNQGASTVVEIQSEGGQRFLVSIFPIHQRDGSSISVVTWKDVTRLSEIQDQLGRSRRLASVGQLAAGVAHEVNNPLAAITTCAEAIVRDLRNKDEATELPEKPQWTYYLEEIVRQSLRCKEITRGLLDLTRQRPAKRILCDVNGIAKDCSRVALQRAGRSVEFAIQLDEGLGEIATDAEMVRQILDNVLTNAVDAMTDTKGRITVSTRRDGDQVTIEIADTGPGVPPDLLAKIFDPFFSTKGPGKGYGLGLAISLTLAESLGGGLNVESKPGEGSKFKLWLPRRAPEE